MVALFLCGILITSACTFTIATRIIEWPFGKAKSTDKPYCYDDEKQRFETIRGSFDLMPYKTARYGNLSCPMEVRYHY